MTGTVPPAGALPTRSGAEREVVVVGAGAAGLWAAARAAELGREVLLLEKTPRTGTKVLASGGTRCNLTTTLGPEAATALFGPRGERFLRRAFRALPPLAVRERFGALGVPTVEAPLEKIFPASGSAREVRDALERWARSAGVEIRVGAPVVGIEPHGAGWRVRLDSGGAVLARALVLTPGGRSYPRTGTTGDGYRWLAALDLPLVEPVPALVPLRSPAPWVRALTGVSLQEVRAQLVSPEGRVLGERARPVVFTHAGISGPGAMDLSEPVARAEGGPPHLMRLDLLPGVPREELRARLIEAAARPGAPGVASALSALEPALPRRLLGAVLLVAGLASPNPPAARLRREERHRIVEALKGLDVPVDGTLGWGKAEVTAGGLDLRALDPATMAVNARPGLFVAGELLDLQGPIGGLNFQSAFATAELAARALAAGAPPGPPR